ncbi:ABC transporter ATP-binding protein [Nakamurella aerolata]|uniref:ABC transporter ATP-binding protein n=1 Tax=Nakamurella aerolata TaxID=1656892 RepID=A0A849A9S4_9ACTN|nr:ABC transporter ATP-binding protein [Nakamurella aerolata]NNG36353.1 ABC transporter ATP-binding protein [Nakamurella aerolata]
MTTPRTTPGTTQPGPLLQAEQLTRVFGTPSGDLVANNRIDLAVAPGELVAVVGPSGAGKSTLLNLLAGLDRPTSGTVRVAGVDITNAGANELARVRREYIGYVFQAFGLLPMLSAAENIEIPLRLLRMAPDERTARIDEVLAEVGLTGHGKQRPNELSGGQQQRVALARALVARPALLLADEPTGQLDSATAETILELIGELVHQHRVAAVVTTHDESLMALADRVLLIGDGVASPLSKGPGDTFGIGTLAAPMHSVVEYVP